MNNENDTTLDITPLRKALQAFNNSVRYVNIIEAKSIEEREFYEFESALKSQIVRPMCRSHRGNKRNLWPKKST